MKSFTIYDCVNLAIPVLGLSFLLIVGFRILSYFMKLWNFYRTVPSRLVEFNFLTRFISSSFSDEQDFYGYPLMTIFLQIASGFGCIFKNEPFYCIWMGIFPFIYLNKPEAIEELLSSTIFIEKSWFYKWLHSWLGTGLLTSFGQKWKTRRKLMTPAFHFDILKDFIPIINEKSMQLVRKFEKITTEDYVDVISYLSLCSLDIICETTFGVDIKAQENKESEYIKAVNRTTKTLSSRVLKIATYSDWIFFLTTGRKTKKDLELLHKFSLSVIEEKKKEMLSNNNENMKKEHKKKPLIEVLLEHHIKTKELTLEDIREEVDTFVFEGHDTTAMALTYTVYLLGLYKDIQDKVYEELHLLFGDDVERPVTKEDLNNMKYMEYVLKEALRLYPPVPILGRRAYQDTKLCGFSIMDGVPLVINSYQLHRNEDIYPNAEVFDPSRFEPENCVKRHPYAYLPFSAGFRNCIGQRFAMMELKVVVANILRNFVLESLDPRDFNVPTMEIVLRPSRPIRIRIRKRL